MNITGVNSLVPTGGHAEKVKGASGEVFGEIFQKSIAAVNDKAQESAMLSEGLVAGQHSNIHETMIAMEESSISFRLLAKAQSKVIDAYKELMRLQL